MLSEDRVAVGWVGEYVRSAGRRIWSAGAGTNVVSEIHAPLCLDEPAALENHFGPCSHTQLEEDSSQV